MNVAWQNRWEELTMELLFEQNPDSETMYRKFEKVGYPSFKIQKTSSQVKLREKSQEQS